MNSRVKTLFGLLVLLAVQFHSVMTRADVKPWSPALIEETVIENASTGQGIVLSSYPFFLNYVLQGLFSWEPDRNLKTEPKKSSIPGLELVKILTVKFDVSDNQHFRKVWFKLTPDLKVRGLLAMQDFKQPRPLVIFRMGIHGNVDELLAERFLLKALYEDLKANVLILESLTSHAFLKTNDQVTFGGVEEGLHTWMILQKIKSPQSEISRLITSVHLLGVSLGAQGIFLTTLIDQYNSRYIKATQAFCPLINLKETFEHHTQKGLRPLGFDLWNILRLRAIREKKDFNFYWFDWAFQLIQGQPYYTPEILKYLNQNRSEPILNVKTLEQMSPDMIWPTGLKDHLSHSQSFYKLNDFWPFFKNVSTPISILTTPRDPLVLNDLNAEKIFSGEQPGDYNSIQFKRLDKGIHCGLPPVYKWSEIVDMLKNGLLL